MVSADVCVAVIVGVAGVAVAVAARRRLAATAPSTAAHRILSMKRPGSAAVDILSLQPRERVTEACVHGAGRRAPLRRRVGATAIGAPPIGHDGGQGSSATDRRAGNAGTRTARID